MDTASTFIQCRSSKFIYGSLIIFIFACNVPLTLSQNTSEEAKLLQEKMKVYNRKLRPVQNASKPVNVTIAFDLLAIKEFDEIHETISVVGFLQLGWTDEFMTWDPDEFSGIQDIMVDSGDIWTPNLVLVNPVNEIEKVDNKWNKVRFYSNGYAIYFPAAVFTAICKMDTTFYPWDVQTCSFVFNTWAHSNKEVQLHSSFNGVLVSFYRENGEWEIIDSSSGFYDNQETLIIFNLSLRRRPTFVLVNVILPIVFMSLLNVLAFLIPTASGERLSYCITVLLAQAVFLTIVGNHLPKTSDPMSILSYYLLAVITISVSITVSVILSLAIYFREERYPVPRYLIKLAELCVGEKQNEERASEMDVQNEDIKDKDKMCMDIKDCQGFPPAQTQHHNQNSERISSISDTDRSFSHLIRKSNSNTIAQNGNGSYSSYHSKTPAYIRSARAREYPISWKDVSVAMDRVLFVVFLLSTVGCMLWAMVRIMKKT